MVRRIVAWLTAHGVADLVLNLHHRPETITAVMGDGGDLGARVRYSWEQPVVLGSGGGPRQALPILGADPFFIVNGDTITDVDLEALADAHGRTGALVTLALVPNREFDRYGGVVVDEHSHVTGFVPRGPSAEGSYHYIGVQAVRAAAFDSIGPGDVARSIGGVYDSLIAWRPGAVRAFVSDAAFFDVGTVADYWRTSESFAPGDDPDAPVIGRSVRIDPFARVRRSILWDDVEEGARAVIDECILTDGVRIAEAAAYRRAILIQRDDDVTVVPFDPANR